MRQDRIGLVLLACSLLVAAFVGCEGNTGNNNAGGGGAGTTSSSTTTVVSSSSSTTVASTSTTGGGDSQVGALCASDVDCGSADGLVCIKTGANDPLLGGGPAGGYCSKPCVSNAECPGDSSCIGGSSGDGICMRNCTFGEPMLQSLNEPLDPEKCFGREDLSCRELNDGTVCFPTCGSDVQCDGRFCDSKATVCVDTPSTGKAIGEEGCTPGGDAPECAGNCISITGGKTMCSMPCTLGGSDFDYECGGASAAVCVYSVSGTELGDVANCARACTEQGQCSNPSFFCFDLSLDVVGYDNGVCLTTQACTDVTDCTFDGAECVETKYGKFCMSAKYPLGTAAPDGTGGAGGAGGAPGTGGAGGAGGAASSAVGAGGMMVGSSGTM